MTGQWAKERYDASLPHQWHCLFRHQQRPYHAIIAYLDDDRCYVWWLREKRQPDQGILNRLIAYGCEPSLDDAMGQCTSAIHRITQPKNKDQPINEST